jgi:glyoxylase-like metal-dependent hydrolase (beta-lactamase superfamily II)
VSWIRVLDAVRALDADIFIPGHGPIPTIPGRRARRSIARGRFSSRHATAFRIRFAQGANRGSGAARVKLDLYSKLFAFGNQREVVLRRIYRELKGTLRMNE